MSDLVEKPCFSRVVAHMIILLLSPLHWPMCCFQVCWVIFLGVLTFLPLLDLSLLYEPSHKKNSNLWF